MYARGAQIGASPGDAVWQLVRGVRTMVRARRQRRGPLRPSWDEDFETWATVLHHYARRSTILPLAVQRLAIHAASIDSPLVEQTPCEPVDADGVPAEWLHLGAADSQRVVVYFHGGGYSIGSIASHRDLIARVCDASGATGFAVDYRLAPEHPFPAQLQDALTAYRWLLARGVAPEHIVLAGESAGGGLTLSTLLALRDAGEPLPAAAVCLSPWLDLEARGPSVERNARYDYVSRRVLQHYAQRFVPSHELRNPLAAPIHADPAGLPPLLVHAGEVEALCDDAIRFAERARNAGVAVELEVYEDMIHAFHVLARTWPPAYRAIEEVGDFVRRQTPR